jgi:hypothetical protein
MREADLPVQKQDMSVIYCNSFYRHTSSPRQHNSAKRREPAFNISCLFAANKKITEK